MTDLRSAYEETCDEELSQWDAQLVLLKSTADQADREVNLVCRKSIRTLQLKQEEARAKQMELKAAGSEVWEDLKAAMEKVRMELRTSFCHVAGRLGRNGKDL